MKYFVKMNTLTTKIIENTFMHLLNKNGRTTSLDVKTELRNNGFYVFQNTVSNAIKEISKKYSISKEYNGQYFVYKLNNNNSKITNKKCKVVEVSENNDGTLYKVIFIGCDGERHTVSVTLFEPEKYSYKITYKNDIICYVTSEDCELTRRQSRYYAFIAVKEKFGIDKYFSIDCRKNK